MGGGAAAAHAVGGGDGDRQEEIVRDSRKRLLGAGFVIAVVVSRERSVVREVFVERDPGDRRSGEEVEEGADFF